MSNSHKEIPEEKISEIIELAAKLSSQKEISKEKKY